jgi:hypothetical protein
MSFTLSPVFTGQQFFDANGNPLAGGKIATFEAGSFTLPLPTFTTVNGDVSNSNPIQLDSAGRLLPDLWLLAGVPYNLVLLDANDEVIDYVDNVYGTPVGGPGGGGGGSGVIWVEVESAPTFLNGTSFQVAANLINEFQVGNRVRAEQGGFFVYGTVTSVSFTSPNTSVVLQMDGGALTGALTAVAWSQITATGAAADAGGVRYTTGLSYSTAGTVGAALRSIEAGATTTVARVDSLRKVWSTAGTGTFTITPSPAITSLAADQVLTVKFTNASTGAATLNVNGTGAIALKQYNPAGTKVDPVIAANQTGDVAYDGTDFVILDSLPPAQAATPRGMQVFTSNGTFTVPAGVTALKVTAIGGGGGGGSSQDLAPPGDPPNIVNGGPGGAGAIYFTYLNTTPGTAFTVSVGAGGAGAASDVFPNGGNGGQSAFGITVCTAQGGFGGQGLTPGVNGTSGAGTPYFVYPTFSYGVGGRGGTTLALATAGLAGCVIVEY